MRPFGYERPVDVADAVRQVASAPGGVFLAGGTNLVDHLKLGVAQPDFLVDVRTLTSREILDLPDGSLRVGAAVTNSELATDHRVRERFPALSQALLAGANAQLRNVATTGGNALQRTRCVYFQDVTTACNKRQLGTGCSAIGGYTRYHAILGSSDQCIATHPSDMAVALAAFDAQVQVLGPAGPRTLPFTELHRLPDDDPARDTVLEHDELITAIDVPPVAAARRSAYRKVRDRASYAFALVSVAAAVELAGDEIRDVRIALGGVAHKPWRATQAEARLRGHRPAAGIFREAAEAELASATPQAGIDNGNAFKIPLAIRTIVATLSSLMPQETVS